MDFMAKMPALGLPMPFDITSFQRGQHAVCDVVRPSDPAGVPYEALLEEVSGKSSVAERLVSLEELLLKFLVNSASFCFPKPQKEFLSL